MEQWCMLTTSPNTNKHYLKVKNDTKCDYDTALTWAVCAKNEFINKNGFSPSQLVFGLNTNLLNFMNNQLVAQETTIKSF